jgi:hypothetical protein
MHHPSSVRHRCPTHQVSIECGTAEHRGAVTLAWVGVMLYPVGCFVLNACLLIAAREHIRSHRKSELTEAISFLIKEYKPHWCGWELCEMGRRLLLVGFLVIGPFHRGSMMQLATATIISIIFLVIQLSASPFRDKSDGFVACNLSLSLVLLFTTCNYYKFSTLTELDKMQARAACSSMPVAACCPRRAVPCHCALAALSPATVYPLATIVIFAVPSPCFLYLLYFFTCYAYCAHCIYYTYCAAGGDDTRADQ